MPQILNPPAVEGLHSLEGLCYGWRLEGDVSWESGSRIQPCESSLYGSAPLSMLKGNHRRLCSSCLPAESILLLILLAGLATEQAAAGWRSKPPSLLPPPPSRPAQTSCCWTRAAPRCATSQPAPPPRAPPCRCRLWSSRTDARWQP